jgi:hypothetical protein
LKDRIGSLWAVLLLSTACLEPSPSPEPGSGVRSDPIPGALGVAIIWSKESGSPLPAPSRTSCSSPPGTLSALSSPGTFAQTLSPTVGTATSYALDPALVPIAAARTDLSASGGSGYVAGGWLIAYLDANGNGQFDPGTPGSPPDPIQATSFDPSGPGSRLILYLAGQPGPGGVGPPADIQQGANVIDPTGAVDPTLLVPLFPPAPPGAPQEPVYAYLSCSQLEHREELGGPPPPGAEISCGHPQEPGHEVYSFSQTRRPGPCVLLTRHGTICRPAGSPRPADWPCP